MNKFKRQSFINVILIIISVVSIIAVLRINKLYNKCRHSNKTILTEKAALLNKIEQDELLKKINAMGLNPDTHVYTGKPVLKVKFLNHGNTAFSIIKDALKNDYDFIYDSKDYDIIIDGVRRQKEGFDDISKDNVIKISYIWEASKPNLEVYDLSLGFDFIEDPKYMRLTLPYIWFTEKISTSFNRGRCDPNKKYFACFLVSNVGKGNNHLNNKPWDGSIARNRMFNILSAYKRVESGGNYLNNVGGVVPLSETNEWLSQCKFTIAYENQSYNGYITEKPYQAYYANTIPLYYADPSVFADLNKKALIYEGDYRSQDEMIDYIKKVDNDNELYCKIWNEKLITNPDKNYEVILAELRNKLLEVINSKHKLKQ